MKDTHRNGSSRRCLSCKLPFTPDPRSRHRQLFCSDPACKKASKALSQNNQEPSRNRAVVYVRISPEHQQSSPSSQTDVILKYARRRGLTIVKEYSDDDNNSG